MLKVCLKCKINFVGFAHLQLLVEDNKVLTVRRQSVYKDVNRACEDQQLVDQRLVIRFYGWTRTGRKWSDRTFIFCHLRYRALLVISLVKDGVYLSCLHIAFPNLASTLYLAESLYNGTALTFFSPIRLPIVHIFHYAWNTVWRWRDAAWRLTVVSYKLRETGARNCVIRLLKN